jgi:hypothetical protein
MYPEFPEGLKTHPLIAELDFNGTKYNTAIMPKTKVMISPRLGLNYDILGNRELVIRGGTGIFTGRIPFVWICSQSGDAGMLQTTVQYNNPADIAANAGPFNPDIRHYLPKEQPKAGTMIPTGGFTIMDPDFKMPQAWKSSLAIDYKLPLGFIASVEGVYNKDINAVIIRSVGLVEPVAMNIAGYPDHRMMYPSDASKYIIRLNSAGQAYNPNDPNANDNTNPAHIRNFNNGAQPLLITNAKDNGYYASLTFKLEKELWEGLSGMIAYTRSWAESLHDGTGDQALSLWRGYTSVHGSNVPALGPAQYVVPNSIIGQLSYKYKNFTTSLFYMGSEDGRTSYTYSNNIVRDGNTFSGINLIYVPKDASEIKFADRKATDGTVTLSAKEQSDAFFKYIEQDPYLKTRKGEYAEKNGLIYPWWHRFDIKYTQDFDIYVAKKKNTIQIGMDITNVGNLLNSKWGNRWSVHQSQLLTVANLNALTPDGIVSPEFYFNYISGTTELPTETFRKTVSAESTYRMQFSLRYIFN